MGIDTLGYVQAVNESLSNQLWTFNYTLAAAIAASRLAVHAPRQTPHPTLAMLFAGVTVAVIGGVARIDTLSNSQIHTTTSSPGSPRSSATLSVPP